MEATIPNNVIPLAQARERIEKSANERAARRIVAALCRELGSEYDAKGKTEKKWVREFTDILGGEHG